MHVSNSTTSTKTPVSLKCHNYPAFFSVQLASTPCAAAHMHLFLFSYFGAKPAERRWRHPEGMLRTKLAETRTNAMPCSLRLIGECLHNAHAAIFIDLEASVQRDRLSAIAHANLLPITAHALCISEWSKSKFYSCSLITTKFGTNYIDRLSATNHIGHSDIGHTEDHIGHKQSRYRPQVDIGHKRLVD